MMIEIDLDLIIDVLNLQVRAGDFSISCELRQGARESLLNGSWDPLDELLEANQSIQDVHNRLAYS